MAKPPALLFSGEITFKYPGTSLSVTHKIWIKTHRGRLGPDGMVLCQVVCQGGQLPPSLGQGTVELQRPTFVSG